MRLSALVELPARHRTHKIIRLIAAFDKAENRLRNHDKGRPHLWVERCRIFGLIGGENFCGQSGRDAFARRAFDDDGLRTAFSRDDAMRVGGEIARLTRTDAGTEIKLIVIP